MEKKYKLLDKDTIELEGRTLYRIQAVTTFKSHENTIYPSTLGGYVQSEENLDHEGQCWVGRDAVVCDSARVRDDAVVYGRALVKDNAYIIGKTRITAHWREAGFTVVVGGFSVLLGRAAVAGNNIRIEGYARVEGASVYNDVRLFGEARLHDGDVVEGTTSKDSEGIAVHELDTDTLTIVNSVYDVTVTPTHLRVGCTTMPFEAWKDMRRVVRNLGSSDRDMWQRFSPSILALAEEYQKYCKEQSE